MHYASPFPPEGGSPYLMGLATKTTTVAYLGRMVGRPQELSEHYFRDLLRSLTYHHDYYTNFLYFKLVQLLNY